MKGRENFLLQFRFQVNQQIATAHQIHARKRRIGHHILTGEHNLFPKRFCHAVTAVLFHKKSSQPLGRNVLRQRFCVQTVARLFEVRVIQVGGENLQPCAALVLGRRFRERHRQRIRFLSGGTAQHPHAHGFIPHTLAQQRWKHFALEHIKCFSISKETGHADQHIGVQCVQFFRIPFQKRSVFCQRLVFVEHEPSCHAPFNGIRLVEGKIHATVVAQQQQNFPEVVLKSPGCARWRGD